MDQLTEMMKGLIGDITKLWNEIRELKKKNKEYKREMKQLKSITKR